MVLADGEVLTVREEYPILGDSPACAEPIPGIWDPDRYPTLLLG